VFGKPPQNNNGAVPKRPAASDQARIQGGGLVQVIVTNLAPLTFSLFLNDRSVPQLDIESLSVFIEAPEADSLDTTIVRATLSRYVTNVTGEKTLQRNELFPCTLEIVALGRRLSITCTNPDSTDGLWIDLGLKPDGTSNEVSDARTLRFLLQEGLLDAKLTWRNGDEEDLLAQ
jgi:hypothetical protein